MVIGIISEFYKTNNQQINLRKLSQKLEIHHPEFISGSQQFDNK